MSGRLIATDDGSLVIDPQLWSYTYLSTPYPTDWISTPTTKYKYLWRANPPLGETWLFGTVTTTNGTAPLSGRTGLYGLDVAGDQDTPSRTVWIHPTDGIVEFTYAFAGDRWGWVRRPNGVAAAP